MADPEPVSERLLWEAELAYLDTDDDLVRSAQFLIRVAQRAQEIAKAAGTSPIDELIDARSKATSPAARVVLNRAMTYLRADQTLSRSVPNRGGFGLGM